jgi:hypothetical protein
MQEGSSETANPGHRMFADLPSVVGRISMQTPN